MKRESESITENNGGHRIVYLKGQPIERVVSRENEVGSGSPATLTFLPGVFHRELMPINAMPRFGSTYARSGQVA